MMRKERSNKGKKRGPYKNRTLKLVENYKSNNNNTPVVKKRKQRKERSNKGTKRGPRKRALQLVANYNSNNNNTPVVKKRKERSNKGKKRGPYKNKRTKHKIPNIVVNDYNNTQRVNKEWKEVENILFNNNNNNRPLVKRKTNKKNNRQLGRTRSGRAFRK